ncbi:type II toxin-antitoxin system VapC family toxin [Tistrella mobilis]|uniref:PIN domain-containing protein n=1 Tax=Tistrella mobilis (strain KA081020-065) TaxID=1110502 RepID=I3TQA2_TISMK|nr:hypothetical protein [Tistrella mobilis]AFK54940.1 hypothetical protein TMO_3102 [Tistrella mobilis KA081020-065]
MRVGLARSLRRLRPETWSGTLTRRARTDLPFADRAQRLGPPLLLDTSVYVDMLEGSASPALDALLETRQIQHSAIAVGELCHNFGRLTPDHPGSADVLRELSQVVDAIPGHRLDAPTSGVLLEAGILAGLLFRLGRLPKGQEVAAFNDAAIYLQALEQGYTVLTRNIRDFDLMNQILPAGRILFYDRTS